MASLTKVADCFLLSTNAIILVGGFVVLPTIFILASMPAVTLNAALCITYTIIGICGICKESARFTLVFAMLVLSSLNLQLYYIIYATDANETTIAGIQRYVESQWEKELKTPGAMDNLQTLYECCGKNAPTDYLNLKLNISDSCYANTLEHKGLYEKGCLEAVVASSLFFGKVFQYVHVGVLAIMFISACHLIAHFRAKLRRSDSQKNLITNKY